MATITTDTYLVSNTAAEAFTIQEGATLFIDPNFWTTRNTFGNMVCITEGRLRIQNDTTDIMVIEMASFNNDFRFEANGVFEIAGQLVEIYTGTGAASQTIDFSDINGVSVNWPSCVWVEIGGELTPFINLGDPSIDALPLPLAGTSGAEGNGIAGFGGVAGSLEMGRFFNFNESTGVATFGDGTNGAVIPNGAKVYFPNIHLTSQKQVAVGSKTSFDFNPTGTMVFENVNLSRDINPLLQASYQIINWKYVGCCNLIGGTLSAGPITYDHVVVCPITDQLTGQSSSQNFSITSVAGDIYIDHLYVIGNTNTTTSTTARSMTAFNNNPNIVKFDNFYLNFINKRNSTSGDAARHLFGAYANISGVDLNNWTLIGGAQINFSVVTNCTMRNWRFSGTPFEPTTYPPNTKWQTTAVVLCSNTDTMKMTRWRVCESGVAYYGPFLSVAANSKNTELYDIVYPSNFGGNLYLDFVMALQSPSLIMKNCVFGETRSGNGLFSGNTIAAANVVIENVRGGVGATKYLIMTNGMQANFVSGGRQFTGLTGAFDMGPFALMYTDNDQVNGTQGAIIAQFQPDSFYDSFELTNSAYLNNAGRLYLPKVNSQATFRTSIPIRGVTDMSSDALVFGGSGLNNLSFYQWEIEFVNAGQEFLGNWATLDSLTDLSAVVTAFNNLINYDPLIGFDMRMRITALVVSPTSYINGLRFNCVVDPTWTAYDAYITFEGGSPTDKYEMRLASDTSVIREFMGVGRHDFTLGDLGGLVVYFVRYVLVDGAYERTASTKPNPITLVYGNNGNILLYVGAEVQVASNDIAAIWAYNERTLTSGFDSADRAQLNKTLTTGKFLALK